MKMSKQIVAMKKQHDSIIGGFRRAADRYNSEFQNYVSDDDFFDVTFDSEIAFIFAENLLDDMTDSLKAGRSLI